MFWDPDPTYMYAWWATRSQSENCKQKQLRNHWTNKCIDGPSAPPESFAILKSDSGAVSELQKLNESLFREVSEADFTTAPISTNRCYQYDRFVLWAVHTDHSPYLWPCITCTHFTQLSVSLIIFIYHLAP